VDDKGRVKVDPETGCTTNPKIYAGGDCINGGKEVVNAVADGRKAARSHVASLSNRTWRNLIATRDIPLWWIGFCIPGVIPGA